jgi:hypothetical protein
MAGMPPGLLQAMAGKSSGGKGKVPSGAIARRLAGKNKKKKKGKGKPPFPPNNNVDDSDSDGM